MDPDAPDSLTDPRKPIDPRRVRFVLVEPQFGGNVGQAARAMKNFGFDRLVVVRPACDLCGSEARMMAVEARDVLERVRVCDTIDAALDGASAVVGTTRRAGKHRRPHRALQELAPDLVALAAGGELALVFGREDHGLADLDLDRCTHLTFIPASASYPSLNLAQAVLLCAWELRRAAPGAPSPAIARPATDAEREALYRHLQEALVEVGFLHDDSIEPIMRRLRRLIGRSNATSEEVKLLRGVARQMSWAARQARLVSGPEPHPARAIDPESTS